MGGAGESRMTSHQAKKLDVEALIAFRDRFALPLTDEQAVALEFYKPAGRQPRTALPARAARGAWRLSAGATQDQRRASPCPRLQSYATVRVEGRGQGDVDDHGGRAPVQHICCKDKTLGPRIVPIVADEARTFGMANLFRQIGIYSPRRAAV